MTYKNCNIEIAILIAKALLSKTFLAIFIFLIVKIAKGKQQLYLAGNIYVFLLFCLKNYNVEATKPAASQATYIYKYLIFFCKTYYAKTII